jgi:outer membrane protein OmpA-like peptidoglycan-associated protein
MKDNKGFRVKIEGHADSSGRDDHNQALSEKRAQAVMDYLVAHGVSKDRLVATGFSSSVPTGTNETVGGRESNRRVEFVVQFTLLNERSTPQ